MKAICLALYLILFVGLCDAVQAQDPYSAQRQEWLAKAEQSKPKLTETIKHPIGLVNLVADKAGFQGWKAVATEPIAAFYNKSLK